MTKPIPKFDTKEEYVKELRDRVNACGGYNDSRYVALYGECFRASDAAGCQRAIEEESRRNGPINKKTRDKNQVLSEGLSKIVPLPGNPGMRTIYPNKVASSSRSPSSKSSLGTRTSASTTNRHVAIPSPLPTPVNPSTSTNPIKLRRTSTSVIVRRQVQKALDVEIPNPMPARPIVSPTQQRPNVNVSSTISNTSEHIRHNDNHFSNGTRRTHTPDPVSARSSSRSAQKRQYDLIAGITPSTNTNMRYSITSNQPRPDLSPGHRRAAVTQTNSQMLTSTTEAHKMGETISRHDARTPGSSGRINTAIPTNSPRLQPRVAPPPPPPPPPPQQQQQQQQQFHQQLHPQQRQQETCADPDDSKSKGLWDDEMQYHGMPHPYVNSIYNSEFENAFREQTRGHDGS
ncbi:hypothetical protein PNOK_0085400 [Pyrrhoderma noxium]|uniref:Uncharacterized protein n=1 Tax=Pyrrhoderma noxium TaxID=2282107 RepID=A0A286UW10_9AGAM|nr:hypothetical protein PNOK_0085400 [Pyrrhoderma noxium]